MRLRAWPYLGLIVTLILALIAGCVGYSSQRYSVGNIGSVELLQPVTVPANQARATFQGGRQVGGGSPYTPYCELEIASVSAQRQVVEKDLFAVTRTATRLLSDADQELSIYGPFVSISCGDTVFYEVQYWLASDLQPGVRRIRCMQGFNACWDPGWYPGLDAIAHTLGPQFVLR